MPGRDAVDRRILNEVRTGSATYEGVYDTMKRVKDPSCLTGIIDSQNNVGGWPELKSEDAPRDTDNDGMPDEWEIKYHLNPSNDSDNVLDGDNDGYTNIEEYLNSTDPTEFVDYTRTENNIHSLH